jgi:hypothetical protein
MFFGIVLYIYNIIGNLEKEKKNMEKEMKTLRLENFNQIET